ncbi:hypothetical protein GUJ93_ZPchr0012g21770 [Zizania palustris]|uniref:Secreted protein n=1 Tax=Zizania palustris TaxID=103762 RepID=A0A8J5WR66_ZIZPA|nr:hypothetical protein GUJ93_ZPchr0012g21770 [Zizania palustris]
MVGNRRSMMLILLGFEATFCLLTAGDTCMLGGRQGGAVLVHVGVGLDHVELRQQHLVLVLAEDLAEGIMSASLLYQLGSLV